ncbi:Protein mono-ADP-ribosyltransferase PARP11 [Geodia barretti]|uniref:Poly [ADP-ribose] polymerase n=1 Tax=Geodia barretti TaxID=519541 RepID=A0AA35U1C6_GEOBA|nr:Protein mono-ADP-ribosyltransferase PARP11 [Geodia barretti]
MKRAKTLPAASTQLKSTHGPVSPSDRVGRWKSIVSETEENRVSAIPQPSIRHTQTAPATSLSRSPTKDPVVSPSSTAERGSLFKDDSGGNPFQQALARCTSPIPQMQTPAVPPSPQQTPAKPPSPRPTVSKKKPQVSETVECSHLTSKRVLFSKHGRELEALREKYGVSLRGDEVEGVALSITGEMRSVQQARNKIIDLEKCVQASISCATFTMSCAFLPCLAGSDTVLSLQSVEKRNAVDFAVMGVNCQMSLTECSQSLKAKLAEIKGPVCLSQVQSFVETRLGYFWKVRNTTTGEFIGLEEVINKKINIAYTERKPTCSFTYNSHVYVVDFLQMTITDQTLEGQVYSLIKEPVWCHYMDDDFDYKPLQESISTIIESIFQQGAPGFITIEGEQCVVDFHSTPMRAYSTTGEHSIIQRRPEVDPSSLTPTVTIRVRGLPEKLAPAEQDFRQILRDKISTEELKIPTKIQGKVTQLLLTTIARQYCVQCVYGADQQVLKLSGTKESVSDVARLLLEETVKIMSESDIPRDQSVTPPHWVPQTSDVQLCPVEKGTSEWTHIEEMMKESLTSVRIETIQRIQNKHLWQKYTFFRRVIQRRMEGRDINEKELFHGTKSNHPSVIYESEKGFDFRFGSSECLWGQGSYFAVKARYSDNGYAYRLSGGSKQLILASVVTGESKFMNKREKLSVPPLKSGSTKERYDTIRATTGGSEIYVVYDHEKAYPAYLITYRT